MSELGRHKVGIVVFMEVDAVDEQDAGNVGQIMLMDMIRAHGHERAIEWRDGQVWHGTIMDVQEVGMAAGNGYLWTRPTVKAWRNFGEAGRFAKRIEGGVDA